MASSDLYDIVIQWFALARAGVRADDRRCVHTAADARGNEAASSKFDVRPAQSAITSRGNARMQSKKTASIVEHLRPGLITGAADDDPSGIATYSQAGAPFGYDLMWTL